MTADHVGHDPEAVDAVRAALADGVLPGLHRLVRRALSGVDAVAGYDGLEVEVLAAQLLTDGAKVFRDQRAGEAEAAGRTVTNIAQSLQAGTTGNARRKAPNMHRFAEARRAADLAQTAVTVDAGGWTVTVHPDPNTRRENQ